VEVAWEEAPTTHRQEGRTWPRVRVPRHLGGGGGAGMGGGGRRRRHGWRRHERRCHRLIDGKAEHGATIRSKRKWGLRHCSTRSEGVSEKSDVMVRSGSKRQNLMCADEHDNGLSTRYVTLFELVINCETIKANR
jgi:hypothetical protein